LRPIQFLGPTLKAWRASILLPAWRASSLLPRNLSGLNVQGSAQLSLLWFIDHCWISTYVCIRPHHVSKEYYDYPAKRNDVERSAYPFWNESAGNGRPSIWNFSYQARCYLYATKCQRFVQTVKGCVAYRIWSAGGPNKTRTGGYIRSDSFSTASM
jgi:hypothetical protein